MLKLDNEELFLLISDYREDIDLSHDEVLDLRKNPGLLEHIALSVREYLDDYEIRWEDIDMSHYSRDSHFIEIKKTIQEAYNKYKK